MNDIDGTILQIIEELARGRTNFFSSSMIRALPYHNRGEIATRFLSNELSIATIANNIYISNTQLRSAAAALVNIGFVGGNRTAFAFSEPVTVTPTAAQIESSLEPFDNTTSNCAICQDAITSNAVRIRQCGHVHHRSCITNWFTMSVRCPVCRHDIRETGQSSQTSVVSSQTSSQSPDQ